MVSTGIQKGGIADRLDVADSVVAVSGDPTRRVSYGGLIGGRYFDLPMTGNDKLGNDLVAEGQAKPKPPAAYKIVGQSPPRFDVPAKVFGTLGTRFWVGAGGVGIPSC